LRVLFGGLKFDAGGKVANGGFGSLVVVQSFFSYSVVAAARCGIINKGVLRARALDSDRQRKLSLKRKLLRLLSLVCGILLIVASPFFIFHTETADQPYPYGSGSIGINPPPGTVYLNYNFYYILVGAFLLTAGIALIVASYYRLDELRLVEKI
jgi:hypothetical protein